LGFFEFVHNVRRRGKALLGALIELLVAPTPRNETQDERRQDRRRLPDGPSSLHSDPEARPESFKAPDTATSS
jgi:hypothetical protein